VLDQGAVFVDEVGEAGLDLSVVRLGLVQVAQASFANILYQEIVSTPFYPLTDFILSV
jgi:hypothetical protein